MITKWKVSNFKSIREDTELDFSPLTIFAGANSSGKSSFIQSVLLVAQTLVHKVSSSSVVLNGALANLGEFNDLKSNDSESDLVTIEFTFRLLPRPFTTRVRNSPYIYFKRTYSKPFTTYIKEISCSISFSADSSSSPNDLSQIHPQLSAVQLSCVHIGDDDDNQIAEIFIEHNNKANFEVEVFRDLNENYDHLVSGLAYKVKLDEQSLAKIQRIFLSAKPAGCTLKHFLPKEIICKIDDIQEVANEFVVRLFGDRFPYRRIWRDRDWKIRLSQEAITVLDEILQGAIDFKSNSRQKRWDSEFESLTWGEWSRRLRGLPSEKHSEIRHKFNNREHELFELIHGALKTSRGEFIEKDEFVQLEPPGVIFDATRCLEDIFTSSFKYIGPLRDAPKSLFPLAPVADPNDTGLRGEHTAFILETHKNKEIEYLPSANFKSSEVNRNSVRCTLENAVRDWLQYLDVASSVESRDLGKLGHELRVGTSDSASAHDLMHVGVGVSQVLPILVTCFLADFDSTIVIEQPELHLHPKVQTLLGDFFLSMALCNKQCLVETHSEYFIDRLRYRIAAALPEDGLYDLTKIYFVELKSGNSLFREVKINEYGAINDWPEGFFDQSQQQAEDILRAAMKKRNDSRKRKDG